MMKDYDHNESIEKKSIEVAIKIGILAVLVIWTFLIIKPFLIPVLWGLIIAVAMEPIIARASGYVGGRRKLVATLFALLVIAILIIPAFILVSSSIDTAQSLTAALEENSLTVPPPPDTIKDWPLIGQPIDTIWSQASNNLQGVVKQYGPQIKGVIADIALSFGSGLVSVGMFIISVIIAAALLATADNWTKTSSKIAGRFAGNRGSEIMSLATATVRGVMQGVVGVAVIQSILSAAGMLVVGVPASGLWAGLVLIFAVIQLPPILVLGPVAVWVFSATETTPAVFFFVWSLLVSASDGFLKPMLMGRGVDIPMLVILIGALGGMMLSGIIGLFVGAVIVAISYTLFIAWVNEEQLTETVDRTQDNA